MPTPFRCLSRGFLLAVFAATGSSAALAQSTLDKVKASGAITVAYRESSTR